MPELEKVATNRNYKNRDEVKIGINIGTDYF